MNEQQKLIADAVLGEQVDAFMRSDVGQYLLSRIDSEYETGIEQLKAAPATDASAVLMAQSKVLRAESMREWLSQAIYEGLNATNVLEGREDE